MFSITRLGRLAAVSSLLIWISACGGSSGSAMPAPSGLSYSSPTAFTANVAITALSPTVTGTVSRYMVTPALPPGLGINAATGVISGIPTAVTAKASYTVTASNAGGSTTAVVAIAVDAVAPVIAYASSYYSFTAGVAAQTITPTVSGGSIVSWSVSPTLPAGLSLNTTTGTISGTPTAGMAATAFVVTAANSGGDSIAKLTLAVSEAALLDVGHASAVSSMAFAGSRLLSEDTSGHWVLWNYLSGAMLASGNAPAPVAFGSQVPVALAGPTAVVQTTTGLQVRATADGSVEADITATLLWWTLASDGSYICGATSAGLMMWAPSGMVLLKQAGDYSKAVVYAAPNHVQAALSPAGQNVIQTIAVPLGTLTVSPTFQGTFQSWFLDGARFLTAVGNNTTPVATVWVYSSSATQEEVLNVAPITTSVPVLAGEGNWFWIFDGQATNGTLNIYSVGASTTPAATYTYPDGGSLFAAGTTLGVLQQSQVSVVDLSGASPTTASYTLPIGAASAFAAASSSSWVAGNSWGVLVDGASLSGTPRYGDVLSIAGSTSEFAIATASGRTLFYDSSTNTLQGTIDFASSLLALSPDGSVLAAVGAPTNVVNPSNQALNVYELPGTAPSNSLTFGSFTVQNMVLSGSGSSALLGLAISSAPYPTPPGPTCYAEAIPVTASMPTWCDTSSGIEQVQISPNGALIAAATAIPGIPGSTVTTSIYSNGTISTAIPSGYVLAWLNNGTLLVNTYLTGSGTQPTVYNGAAIFSSTGTQQTAVPLPELDVVQVLSAQSIYSAHPNGIFSLPSGAETWTSASPLSRSDLGTPPSPYTGAVTGSEVIFPSGNLVLAESTAAP
jgi:Putative Ig domain